MSQDIEIITKQDDIQDDIFELKVTINIGLEEFQFVPEESGKVFIKHLNRQSTNKIVADIAEYIANIISDVQACCRIKERRQGK